MIIQLDSTILLRPWEAADRTALVKYLNNPRVVQYLGERIPQPYTLQDADAWTYFCRRHDELTFFAIEAEGEAVGSMSLEFQTDIYRKSFELGYWLAEPFWGRGISSKAVRAICEYGFRNFDINRIFARPFSVNQASVRVLENAGFVLEGRLRNAAYKHGQFYDMLAYALLKE